MKRAFIGALTLTGAFLATERVSAQALTSVLPEEPPSSLFSGKLGDADVEAFAQGFWEATVLSSGAWSVGSDSSGFNSIPFLFTQTPDLYTYLKYRERWFFEAYVTQDSADSLFLLSFEGGEDDFVKSARLGNSGIEFPDYPYLSFGTPGGSFGFSIHAYDDSKGASYDAMVRWDGLSWESRDFFGSAEAVETEILPSDHLRGRRFVLPDSGIRSLTLSDTRAGSSRLLATDEFVVDLANSTILLDAEPRGVLSASYVTAAGIEKSLVLYELGTDDEGNTLRTSYGYEARNLYAVTGAKESGELFVRSAATGLTDSRFAVTSVGDDLAQVIRDDAGPGDDGFMQPFAEDSPWVYNDDNDGYPDGDGFVIIRRVVQSFDAITLDEGTVEGTITVYRDGVGSTAFTYDDDSKTLTLSPPPMDGETIQVRYAVESQDNSDGALAFAAGARWPWLGLSWSAALGGRVPLFGLGYDEEGELKSSWMAMSIGSASEWEGGEFNAAIAARYQKAGASGIYRIEGMEDTVTYDDLTTAWIPSLRPVEGDTTHLSASSALVDDLGDLDAFSSLIEDLHPSGGVNRAFSVSAEAGATGDATRYIRYISAAPLSSYKSLAFFMKPEGASPDATMTLSVGDGQGEGAALTVPLDAVDGEWVRIQLSLDPADPALSAFDGDGAAVALPGASGSFSVPGSAGLLEITFEGLLDGTVTIDEVTLLDSADGPSAMGTASLSIGERRDAGPWLEAKADASAMADPASDSTASSQEASAAASLEAGWNASFLRAAFKAAPWYADSLSGMGLGYRLEFPNASSPTRLVDQYYRDQDRGSYARSLDGAAAIGPISIGAAAKADESDGVFSQAWSARIQGASLLSLKGAAALTAPTTVSTEASAGEAWLASWGLLAPASEGVAEERTVRVDGTLLGSFATAALIHRYDESEPASSELKARIGFPLKAAKTTVEPYYWRDTAMESQTSSAGFLGDAGELLDAAIGAASFWAAAPFYELWSERAFDGFSGFITDASAASHEAGAGIRVQRPIGLGLVDLLLPSTFDASYSRALEYEDDSLSELGKTTLKLSGGAANVFASGGAAPLFGGLEFDEYTHALELTLSYYPSDGALLPSASANQALSFKYSAGSALAITASQTYAATRDSSPWLASIGVALSTKPAHTWFGDVAGMAIGAASSGDNSEGGDGAPGRASGNWVSAWLESAFIDAPALKETFTLDASLSRSSTTDAPLVGTLTLAYVSSVSAGAKLSLSFGAELSPSMSLGDDETIWGMGYEFSLSAKVIF